MLTLCQFNNVFAFWQCHDCVIGPTLVINYIAIATCCRFGSLSGCQPITMAKVGSVNIQ